MGAGVVKITARRPGGADRSDHLVAHFDDDAPAQQKQMRQFEQVRQHRHRLRPFNERARVGLRDNRRDRLVRELRGDALGLEETLGMGLAQEKSGAERG
jgi:hypothetical protein